MISVQGYLAHKKPPLPLGPPYGPRRGPTVGCKGGAVAYERGNPVVRVPTLEATQGQVDGFSGQVPYKCHLNRVASVGD